MGTNTRQPATGVPAAVRLALGDADGDATAVDVRVPPAVGVSQRVFVGVAVARIVGAIVSVGVQVAVGEGPGVGDRVGVGVGSGDAFRHTTSGWLNAAA